MMLCCRAGIRFTLLSSLAYAVVAPVAADELNYRRDVLPLLKSHCVRCHGAENQEANIRLDTLSTDLISDRAAAESWHEVMNVLNAGEMPPKDEKQLTAAQREVLTRWVSTSIKRAIEAQRTTGGRVVLRRLNRVAYQNTMTDLLGLEMDYVGDLPPDSVSSDGFTNNGQSMQMSALQLEYYLSTARRALGRVIVGSSEPQVFEHEFTESYAGGWLGKAERSNRLGRQQEFLAKMTKDYPEVGDFRVRVTLSAELKKDVGYPLLEVAVGYRPDTKILFDEFPLVEITEENAQTLEFHGRIEDFPLPVRGQGKFPGLVVRLRNVYDDGSPRPKAVKKDKKDRKKGTVYPSEPHLPVIIVEKVEFRGPLFEQWPPERHRRILVDSPLRETDESAYVREVLQRFMPRAYRRPVLESEIADMVEFFDSVKPGSKDFAEAIRETLAMVLIRPEFLYLVEPAGDAKQHVDDWQLASRLSYFLWDTMPDQPLIDLAASGQLQRQEVLEAQLERMLNDSRSQRFVEQFTAQWLQLNVIESVAVSPDYYPQFDDALKAEMRQETQQFFAELLAKDMSALNLLSSDFTMLNEPLAKHYGIEGVWGRQFRRVKLAPNQHRGGLLGQASILLANSTGSDSHAVRRAVWLRDRLLDDPPADPPPDVPSLDEADPKFAKLSVREQLKVHRGTESCASCHRSIDPWGVAMENFDAVGNWREEIRRKSGKKFETLPVVAKDVLPSGRELDGIESLKKLLVEERKRDFARSLVKRLLIYSLGRSLELSDEAAIDDLTNRFAKDGYKLRSLVRHVVTSELFRTK